MSGRPSTTGEHRGAIDRIFAALREAGRAALMPYITAGYPTLDVTARTIPALDAAGADIIEIGFPFSDPIADGPVIAASMHEAIAGGATPPGVFDVVSGVREQTSAGLVAMVSDSIVSRMGRTAFFDRAAEAGFDGLIIPDIDLADAEEASKLARDRSMSFSLLVAPTTAPSRLGRITSLCSGFVYVLARLGITGESGDGSQAGRIEANVARIREHTALPLAVGFGISTPQQVAAAGEIADGVIVGSALVRRMGTARDPVAAAREFVGQLARGGRAVRSAAEPRR